MEIDFSQEILDIDGKPLNEGGEVLTLRRVCARALSAMTSEVQGLSADEKLKRGSLALKIFDGDDQMTLKAEDVALIKKTVGMVYGPIVIARAFPLLDEAESERSEKTGKKVAGE